MCEKIVSTEEEAKRDKILCVHIKFPSLLRIFQMQLFSSLFQSTNQQTINTEVQQRYKEQT